MPHGHREGTSGDASQGKGRLCQGAWYVLGTYMAVLVSKQGHRCDRCWGGTGRESREMGVRA